MAKKHLGLTIWFLVLASAAQPAGADSASVVTVALSKVHPTQMQVGMAAVRQVIQSGFIDRAIGDDPDLAEFHSPPSKTLDQLTPAQRNKLREKLAVYLAKNPPAPIRAVRSPNGSIFITDGHHRTTALEVLSHEGKPPLVDPKKAQIRVSVDKDSDFRGRPAAFETFVAKHGFFTIQAREKFARHLESAHELVTELPKTMTDLAHADSPLRSTVGKIFYDVGINGEVFDDYLEFYIGEQVECESGSTPGHEFDDDTLERTRRAIFGNPEVVSFLRSKEAPEPQKAAAETQLLKALAKYKAIEAERVAKGLPEPKLLTCSASMSGNRGKKPAPLLETK